MTKTYPLNRERLTDSGAPADVAASHQATTKHHVDARPHPSNLEELIAWVVRAQRLKLITIKEAEARTATSRSFITAEAAAGRFPRPVKLGASKSRRAAARFVDSEISDWIEKRMAERPISVPGKDP